MSSKERGLIEVAILRFRRSLHSSLPLTNVYQFYDESMIRDAVELEKRKVLKQFMDDISGVSLDKIGGLVNELCLELQKIIEKCIRTNEDHRSKVQASIKKDMKCVCENLKRSVKERLKMNRGMHMKSIEEFFEKEKLLATSAFEQLWTHGNVALIEEHKQELGRKLDHLGKEILDMLWCRLKSKETEKVLEEMKAAVWQKTNQLKCYVRTFTGPVSKTVLKEKAQDVYDFVLGRYSALNETFKQGSLQPLHILEDAINVLDVEQDIILLEDAIEWTEILETELESILNEIDVGTELGPTRTEANGGGTLLDGTDIVESYIPPDTNTEQVESTSLETHHNIIDIDNGESNALENLKMCEELSVSNGEDDLIVKLEKRQGSQQDVVAGHCFVDSATTQGIQIEDGRKCFFNVACRQKSLEIGHSLEEEQIQFESFLKAIRELECTKWEDIGSKPNTENDKEYTYFSLVSTEKAAWYPYVARYKDNKMRFTYPVLAFQANFWTSSNRSVKSVVKHLQVYRARRSSLAIGIMLWENPLLRKPGHCVLLVLYPGKDGLCAFIKDSHPVNHTSVPEFAKFICQKLHISNVTLIAEPPSESAVLPTGCMKDAMKAVGDLLDGRLLDSVKQVPLECSQVYSVTGRRVVTFPEKRKISSETDDN